MSVVAYRICKAKYAKSAAAAFDGQGARRSGGRWNSPGNPVVYTAQSTSLATLEMLVHLDGTELLHAYKLIDVEIPLHVIYEIDRTTLPEHWYASPGPAEISQLGNDWIAGATSAVLKVPSAIIVTEFNYLINPLHPDFPLLKLGHPLDFQFDPRLKKS